MWITEKFAGKHFCTDQAMRYIIVVNQPVLVPPSFQMFSADSLPQRLQTLPVAILLIRLARMNKRLTNMIFRSKNITNLIFMFDLTCLAFFGRLGYELLDLHQ
jgi:hypothetical protein